MRTIETKVYKFDELSESGKAKAINNLADINVSHDWWDSVYEDAKMIGLEITSFDVDKRVEADIESGVETMRLIFENHGESCDTYKTALAYESAIDALPDLPDESAENYNETERLICAGMDECEAEFLRALCEDYRIILRKEYEYLTSEESIIETILANYYEFTEDGKLI